ncbi:MAG: hypothetical protein WB676_13685 [Bryobacteraceae bacterium]
MSTSLPKRPHLAAWARPRIRKLRLVPIAVSSTSPDMVEAAKELLRGQPEWFLVGEEFDTLEREAQRLRGHELSGQSPLEALFRAALDFDRVLRRVYPALPVALLVVFYKCYQLRMHLEELADQLEKGGADKFACAAALRQIKALLSDYGDELALHLPQSEALTIEPSTRVEPLPEIGSPSEMLLAATKVANSKAALRCQREDLLERFRNREQERLGLQNLTNKTIYEGIGVSSAAFYAWLKVENNPKKDTPNVCKRIEDFLQHGRIRDKAALEPISTIHTEPSH